MKHLSRFNASLLLAVSTMAVFGQTCLNGFTNFDDIHYITENAHVRSGLSAQGIEWAFTSFAVANWHPLTWISLQIDAQLYGLWAPGYHFTNVLLHVGNTLLLFSLLVRITGSLPRSVIVAALFSLHPLHVESVAWVAERKDVLSTFFGFVTMILYVKYVERPGLGRYLMMELSYAFSLMAKPMLVTLPCVLLLLDYWPLSRFGCGVNADSDHADFGTPCHPAPGRWRLLLGEKVPLVLLALAVSGMTLYTQHAENSPTSLDALPLSIRVANVSSAYVRYIVKMFWPEDLAVFYPFPPFAVLLHTVGKSGLFLGIVSILAIMMRRRRPYIIVGWLWYLLTLIPVIGLVQVGMQSLADRYTYVPLIGLFILLTWSAADILGEWRLPLTIGVMGSVFLVGACMIGSSFQIRYWRDAVTLWEHAIRVTRDNFVAHANLADALTRVGRMVEADYHRAESRRIRLSGSRSGLK